MRIINVIEIVDNNVMNIESFPVWEEQLCDDVVRDAEDEFEKCMKAHLDPKLVDEYNFIIAFEECVVDGLYNYNNYSVNIVWSYIDE